MPDAVPQGRRPPLVCRPGLYVIAVAVPAVVELLVDPRPGQPGLLRVAVTFAVAAYALLAAQFILSTRLPAAEPAHERARLVRCHQVAGLLTAVLILLHPLTLSWGMGGWALFAFPRLPWFLYCGHLGGLLLVVLATLSLLRRPLRLAYGTWTRLHVVLGGAALTLGFAHCMMTGEHVHDIPVRLLYGALLSAAVLAYGLRRRGSTVEETASPTNDPSALTGARVPAEDATQA